MYLTEKGHFVSLFNAADHTTAASSEVFALTDYAHATIIIQKGAGSASTIVLEACDDFVPTTVATFTPYWYCAETTAAGDTLSALAAATTAGVAISANTGTLLIFEVDAAALPAGYPNLRITHTAAGASIWSAVACLTNPRYGADVTQTAIV